MIEELLSAARQGDGDAIRNLLVTTDRANELINLAKDRMTGAGPLHLAAESGSVEAIEALSRLGWRATARDAELATALHYAAARGHAAAVASLCALGADVAARDERDCVPLHYSAGGGKWDAARALLVRGADPNAPDKDERTPLHYAARRGCPKTTGLLVNGGWGTRLDATSARGTTALSEAVEHKRAAAAEVLAAAGAAVGAEDGDDLARLLRGDGATRAGGTGVGDAGIGSGDAGTGTLVPVPPRAVRPNSPGGGRGYARGGRIRSPGTFAPPPFPSSSLSSSGASSPASVYSPPSSRPSSASDFEGHGGWPGRGGRVMLEPLDHEPALRDGPGWGGRDAPPHMAPRRAGDTKQSFLSKYGLANKAGLFRVDE
ncbi:predicted protein [Micromonas commoda]|uniref:Uncharacterized protein n=1 Tax=Micromonas commoda (strain RCC299 / NOUM17 / CCMP2709) TaxID=296587 RepID=C1DZF7_MICCC|nr:predicted protein [Micromonas commoda]ACO60643.1 predicted protein [Micromonas commoda]|eukprot:XP_002499384.1 predicted protein [Micromonas commoda]